MEASSSHVAVSGGDKGLRVLTGPVSLHIEQSTPRPGLASPSSGRGFFSRGGGREAPPEGPGGDGQVREVRCLHHVVSSLLSREPEAGRVAG